MAQPITAPERKPLIEWTKSDDSDFSNPDLPATSAAQRRLHALLAHDASRRAEGDLVDRLAPPPGFALAPLG